MKYLSLIFKHTTDSILSYCHNRDDNKAILISSTASRATYIQQKLDSWLDTNANIKGNTLFVIGNLEIETKSVYITKFTNTFFGAGGDTF